jgi:hypothetical protein
MCILLCAKRPLARLAPTRKKLTNANKQWPFGPRNVPQPNTFGTVENRLKKSSEYVSGRALKSKAFWYTP